MKHYDPRSKATTDDGEVKSVVWTTQSVNWAKEAIMMGQEIKRSPFFEGNPSIRRGEIVFQFSDWEMKEIVKCANDIRYFIETYCQVKRPDGKIGPIKLREYQEGQIEDYLTNDQIILGWSRQSGKTIGTALYILWAMIFNADKQTAILANKAATSGEVLSKIKEIFKFLPFWMQPGCLGWNGSTLALDNGCKMYTGPTTQDALNGKTCNILYIDEFAFVGQGANKIEYQKEFLANSMPVLSSQKHSGLCKLIITSTPNGKDYYYELFSDAMLKKNRVKASKVCWWQIPGKDLQWAEDEIAVIGLAKFRCQYEMSFDVTATTLLNSSTLRRITGDQFEFSNDAYDLLSDFEEHLYFREDVDIDFEEDVFCVSVDIGEGLGQDYSVAQILRLDFDDEEFKFKFEQVGVFYCNTISIDDFADVVAELFTSLNPEYSKLLVEQNTYGDYFFKCLNVNPDYDIDLASICKFKRSSDAESVTKGLRHNRQTKPIAVKSFKTLMDCNTLQIFEKQTVKEIENFQEDNKGNYKASIGHDDTVMPLVNFSYFMQLNEVECKNWLEDFCELNEIIIDPSEAAIASKSRGFEDEIDEDASPIDPEVIALLNSM